jgi:hypothetical protein
VKLKTDDQGRVVVSDGMPVYVYDDGTEKPFDASKAADAIKRLNGEAKTHRERAEAAEAKARLFEGLEDPDEARKALETVKSLDGKTKAEVEKVRAEVGKAMAAKIEAAEKRTAEIEARLHDELIGGGFARSKFIGERLAIPADIAQAVFGPRFAVEGGRLVAKDASGNPILTREGQPASFDEALETLVGGYAGKDSILKATQKSGSGAQPGAMGGKPAVQTMSRKAFTELEPSQKMELSKSGVTLTDA